MTHSPTPNVPYRGGALLRFMDWILVVDDDAVCLKLAVRLLSDKNKKVTPLKSGQDFLDFYEKKTNKYNTPDVVLMDIAMPEMDGFETFKKLRELEQKKDLPEIPVVFATASDESDAEKTSFALGAADYIKKPFDQAILLKRLDNIIETQNKIKEVEREAITDKMTGFLNKQAVDERISELCETEAGSLIILDLDSFKLVNDIYGHDMGDRILKVFAELINKNMVFENITGRIGGDEFLIFGKGMSSESDIRRFTDRINNDLLREARRMFGGNMNLPLGVSVGAVFVPDQGKDFTELFHLADQALYSVKNNGKHGYALCRSEYRENTRVMDLKTITSILDERSVSKNAIWMGEDAFIGIYRYMIRYMKRYHRVAYRVLLTMDFVNDDITIDKQENILEKIRKQIQDSLRNSDIMMQTGDYQFFLLLPEVQDKDIDNIMNRIMTAWDEEEFNKDLVITYETGSINFETKKK